VAPAILLVCIVGFVANVLQGQNIEIAIRFIAYAGTGGEVAAGLALSFPVPYFDPTAKLDVGGYFTIGGGVGANVGPTANVGFFRGDIPGLNGPAVSTGAGVGPVGFQLSYSLDMQTLNGISFSFGPRAPVPIFGSTAITNTKATSFAEPALPPIVEPGLPPALIQGVGVPSTMSQTPVTSSSAPSTTSAGTGSLK
jgi:hypothetical protein